MLKYDSLKYASDYVASQFPVFGGNWSNAAIAGILTANNSGTWGNGYHNHGVRDLQKYKSDEPDNKNDVVVIVRDVLDYSLKAIKSIAPFLFSSECENQLRSVL